MVKNMENQMKPEVISGFVGIAVSGSCALPSIFPLCSEWTWVYYQKDRCVHPY